MGCPQEAPGVKQLIGYVRDEQGIETLEWVTVGALIVGMSLTVYPGALGTAITTVIGNIQTALTGIPGL